VKIPKWAALVPADVSLAERIILSIPTFRSQGAAPFICQLQLAALFIEQRLELICRLLAGGF